MNEAEILAKVLDLVAGYEIRLGQGLAVLRLDDDAFIVEYETQNSEGNYELREKSFTTGQKASEFFVEHRLKYKVGADFDIPDED